MLQDGYQLIHGRSGFLVNVLLMLWLVHTSKHLLILDTTMASNTRTHCSCLDIRHLKKRAYPPSTHIQRLLISIPAPVHQHIGLVNDNHRVAREHSAPEGHVCTACTMRIKKHGEIIQGFCVLAQTSSQQERKVRIWREGCLCMYRCQCCLARVIQL